MRPLQIKDDYEENEITLENENAFADLSDADEVIDQNTEVRAPDGTIVAVLLRSVIPAAQHMLGYELWKEVDSPLTNRVAATASHSLPRSKNLDGSLNRRWGTHKKMGKVLDDQGARQGVLGWDAKDGGLTKDTLKHPEMLKGNRTLIKLVDSLYKQHVPSLYAVQRAAVKANNDPHCRLSHTAFTNCYVLKQWPIPYHRDTNNLHGVLTAIICCGEFSGAELILPRWRIAFAYRPGDLLMFNPQTLHGVPPFVGWRLSAAFYCSGKITVVC